MNYTEVIFDCVPNTEIVNCTLTVALADIGFESFVETECGTTAYIQTISFDEKALTQLLAEIFEAGEVTFTYTQIEDKDWNEEWEKNYFKPLIIDNRCIIQSTFHNEPAIYEYNILIDPKMAFGTGHHQTTELIIREILDLDCTNKTILDMGCGTAILAILASMRGAKSVLAIDIDKWAYDNAIENLNINKIENVKIEIGDAKLLGLEMFDIIFANINRNILLTDIHSYASVLNTNGELYMSGFYVEDIPAIRAECEKYNLKFISNTENNNWAAVKFVKK